MNIAAAILLACVILAYAENTDHGDDEEAEIPDANESDSDQEDDVVFKEYHEIRTWGMKIPRRPRVFISFRAPESLEFVKKLQKKLKIAGIDAFACMPPAGSWLFLETVIEKIDQSDIFLVVGTETYGKDTETIVSTRRQLIYAIESKKRVFLIKLCRRFRESVTRFLINSAVPNWYHPDFDPEEYPDDELVEEIQDAVFMSLVVQSSWDDPY